MVFHTKICKENAGNIISVTDPAGTITYNYRPDGQLDNIVAPESITTSFQYDDYDRQISMTDPSFGTIKYTYDAAGNVNKETYADGNITKKTYDKHHRLTKKEVAGQTITYTYNADNLIVSEVSSNGTSKTYEYDFHLETDQRKCIGTIDRSKYRMPDTHLLIRHLRLSYRAGSKERFHCNTKLRIQFQCPDRKSELAERQYKEYSGKFRIRQSKPIDKFCRKNRNLQQ